MFPTPKPTVIKDKSVFSSTASSVVFSNKTLDKACPYSAEYPPVEKVIPLNKKGENRPRVGMLFADGVYGVNTRIPSTKICVSSASPPRTKSRPSSSTFEVPGKVCKAPTKSPNALAVVTTSNGFKAVTLALSPASKVPALIVTASNVFTSSLNFIINLLKSVTNAVFENVSKEIKETINVFVPFADVVKEKFPFSSDDVPS